MSGILHGGPNPVIGATMTLYTTGSDYGASATVISTTTTDSNGFFNFALPSTSAACPSGKFAYVTAYSGSTGSGSSNPNSLLMVPVGSCDANYTTVASTDANNVTTYVNTYNGPGLWIDELTTAMSAYALSGFMSVTGGTVNIGAPANNTATASTTTASAAGLSHAFANALNLFNNSTGQPYANYANRSAGGVIPDAEIYLLGNILQACVNSNGVTGTNTATANDGSPCGKLFSMTTPPSTGAATPTNTLAAMLNLVHFPNPSVNTWNSTCTAAASGTTTATNCLFNLAAASGAYVGALTSAPPDWTLAVVYPQGYGVGTGCASGSTCGGINYAYHVATDYADNVYVLNTDSSTPTFTNIDGFAFDGTPLFATANDSTHSQIRQISTDTIGHVMGTNATTKTAATNFLMVYGTGLNSTTAGALVASVSTATDTPVNTAVDPYNNVFFVSNASGGSLRRAAYSGSPSAPTYTVSALTPGVTPGGSLQIGFDSNLGIYVQESTSGSSFKIDYAVNTGTFAAPAYTSAFVSTTVTAAAAAASSFGLVVDSSNNAYAAATNGWYKVTKANSGSSTSLSAGSTIAIPVANSALSTIYTRFLSTDGLGYIYGPDNANGGYASGVSVYDAADGLALGTYKGCYVVSKVCGTTASTTPIYSPRGVAIDSSGDLWVVAGASHDLTEMIGAAAPTWPALSMVKTGRPQ
ncbi:hypothetical protein ACFQBQ_02220 [Granulicella cerasi]|uniref:Uncharacterized protein n=1 Tax=Granulicella cerasi TaxID=741063 RepID=A0ABW1Z4D8_9BACT|nr:hypothetical protein [Granulicella cerasi]